jgi:acyl-CoA thioester hydrolase
MRKVARYRVLYGDTDQMGFLYYGNYMRLFEIGRAEWIRTAGGTYHAMEKGGTFLPVVEAYARYKSPARYDDLIEIAARPADIRRASVKFEYELHREGELVAIGHTLHAFTGADGRPKRMPDDIMRLLGGDEHGS